MDHPFTCKFATALHKDISPEIISHLATENEVDYNQVSSIEVERFHDIADDFITSHCKGQNSILTIKLKDSSGTSEERLSKLMDNTRGSMNLLKMRDELDVGLIIFHGELPPILWLHAPSYRIICDNQ